jgi:ATP-dependent RNA helicase RhlE
MHADKPSHQPQQPFPQQPGASFYGLGIAPGLLKNLDKLKFTVPTPIQLRAIPIALEGRDLMGIAQTGTGKTLAFAVPMLQRLAQKPGRALILLPTRELALQVNEVYQQFRHSQHIDTAVLIGGASMNLQLQQLRRNPHVIIATPGRLIDHLDQGTVRLNTVHTLVLDEADRMLDMGFMPQIERILQEVPSDRQTMLFSATMPEQIVHIAKNYMKLPVRTEITPSGTTVNLVTQELYIVAKDDKKKLLAKLLRQYTGTVLLFTRTRRGANLITRDIIRMGHRAAEIHSDRSLKQRREALDGFKSGRYRILVATDIASRGIDVQRIELVINYDLPDEPENYVHRIGRTARAGHTGRAITLAMPDQGYDLKQIERLIRAMIPVTEHPEVPSGKFLPSSGPSRGKQPLWKKKLGSGKKTVVARRRRGSWHFEPKHK